MTLAVLCPGQGAQHAAMLALALSTSEGQRAIQEAAGALGLDPARWLGSDAMFVNAHAQPLICITQNAQWRALRDRLPRPAAVAGYSVGELSAYGVADALDVASLATLARARAAAMDAAAAAAPGGLLAIRGLARDIVAALCATSRTHIAIAVDERTFIIGGTDETLTLADAQAQAAGGQPRTLRVGVPAHTPLLAAAVAPFEAALSGSSLRDPTSPVVAGIDGGGVRTRARAIDTLARQVAHTIEWGQCLDALHERGCRVYLELGPGQALSKMVRERFDDVHARAVDDFRTVGAVAAWVNRTYAD